MSGKTEFIVQPVVDDGGWIIAVDISDGDITMRVPIKELHRLESVSKHAYIDATERCGWCNGSGKIDVGDPMTFCDEHYVGCDKCNGSGRLRKNVNPRVKCKHENFTPPDGRGYYCMAHCANKASPVHGKVCDDHLRRDCKVKEENESWNDRK